MAGFLHGRPALAGSLVVVGLVVTAAATYAAGGTKTVAPQLAHVFVVTAGVTLGPLAGAGSGVAAGVLLGPWMPLDVASGMPQSLGGWLVRLAVFGVVGAGAGLLAKGLRDADTTLRETLERIPVAVTAITGTTPNATIHYANAAAVEMFGDVEGRTIAETFGSLRVRSLDGRLLTRADIEDAPRAIAQSGVPGEFDITDLHGTRRIVQLRALRAPSGQTLAVVEDVSARSRFDQTRRHLITLAGHHMRTPLTPIVGFSGLVRRHAELTDDPQLREYGEILERSAERLHTLVERLTQLTQLRPAPAHHYQDVPVRRIAEQVTADLAGSDAIEIHVPADLIARAVPSHVSAALGELLTNSLSHGSPPVTVSAVKRGDQIDVHVRDSGGGLPDAADTTRLFGVYSSIADSPETDAPRGQGLGLALALAHCHATEATLTYDSAATTFTVSLPLAAAAHEPER